VDEGDFSALCFFRFDSLTVVLPIDSRLDAPHCRSGRYSEDTHLLPRLGSVRKFPSRQVHRLITIPAEPPRLWSENLRQPLIQIDKIPKFGMYDFEEAIREEERKFRSVEGEVPVPVLDIEEALTHWGAVAPW